MSRQLYVTTKEFTEGRILIGVLIEEKADEYKFRYKLDGKVQKWHLPIREFPDVTKVYEGDDVKRFISRIIPEKDSPYIKHALVAANIKEYDTWELLKVFGQRNKREDAFVFENLPEGIIAYEPVGL